MSPKTIRQFFQEASWASFQQWLKLDQPPIIIGGCGRSGTTLLLAILGAHENIYAFPDETAFFMRDRRYKAPKLNYWSHQKFILSGLLRADLPSTTRRWCEKSPKNVRFLPQILAEFGEKVKFIHLVRDGRDVITSRHPSSPEFYVSPERWIRDVSAGHAFANDPRVYTMKYEDLTQKPEETLQQLCSWLNLPFSESLLSFTQHTNVQRNAAWKGKVRSLSTNSVKKWERNPELQTRVELLTNNEVGNHLLYELGYIESEKTFT